MSVQNALENIINYYERNVDFENVNEIREAIKNDPDSVLIVNSISDFKKFEKISKVSEEKTRPFLKSTLFFGGYRPV